MQHVANAWETDDPKEYLEYSAEEKALICENLNACLNRIERVSVAAADLIKQHIKVIIPLKATNRSESGSTSQPRFPGRVLLRGVEHGFFGWLASSLVHEAMHQVLYILEWAGLFTIGDSDVKANQVKSGWTGRDLQPHSHIHACFIWYGVSNFRLRARSSDAFDANFVESELAKSMAGFLEQNPVERLAPCSGMVRYDVLRTAGTLQGLLKSAAHQTTVSAVSSICHEPMKSPLLSPRPAPSPSYKVSENIHSAPLIRQSS
jgi:hypothetical protein